MKNGEGKKNRPWAIAALAGALGGLLGLLLAPRRGRELRAALRDGSVTVRDAIRDRLRTEQPETDAPTPPPPLATTDYDAIVVGAGHNGLVAAAYLAKAGLKVLVVERREQVGGAAVTESFFPDYQVSAVAGGAGYLEPQIVEDLQLTQHGLIVVPTAPLIFSPLPGGDALTIWQDAARTAAEIARFSEADAERYQQFVSFMRAVSAVVRALMNVTPPDLPDVGARDLLRMSELSGPVRRLGRHGVADFLRVMPMPVADLLNEWFESDALKGLIAANGVRGITWGPMEAGTAYMLLQRWATTNSDLIRSSGVVQGGMGALSGAIARAARSYGAEIRTSAPVSELIVRHGRVSHVRLEDGSVLAARLIVSNADMRTTFLNLLDPSYLDRRVVRHVRNIKYRGSAARVHFALERLPTFTALGSRDPAHVLGGAIQFAPHIPYLQRAYDHVKYGEMSAHPYLDMRIPTIADPALAPAGKHILSATVQYMPYHLRHQQWQSLREELAERVIVTLERVAPDFGACVSQWKVLTACDLETVYGLPEGNPHHGEMTLDQFLHMRPIPGYARYQSPVAGLYLCGAGTHPGGGVTGIPGKNAAREILRAWRA